MSSVKSLFGSDPWSASQVADYLGVDISPFADDAQLTHEYLLKEVHFAISACALLAQRVQEDIGRKPQAFPKALSYVAELISKRSAKAQGTPSDLSSIRSLIQSSAVEVPLKLAARLKTEIDTLYGMLISLSPNTDPSHKRVRDTHVADVEKMLGWNLNQMPPADQSPDGFI